jgi:cation diffusion facilitator family transporter
VSAQPQAPPLLSARGTAIRRVLWLVLALNWGVAAGKLAAGYSVNSLAMIADGFHSLLDGSSNVVGLVGIYFAARPPDADHPYGHQKYEAFAALGISLMLGVTAIELVREGAARVLGGARPLPSLLGFTVMLVSLAVNLGVTRYEARKGAELRSDVLLADAAHTRSDVLVSLSVIAGLAAAYAGVYWLDPLVAFAVAGLILYIAYGVLRRVFIVLTDSTSLTAREIEQAVLEVPEVLSCSNIRSRGDPPSLFIDLEIQLDPDFPLWKAHRIAHVVMDQCRARFHAADVVVHAEPQGAQRRRTPHPRAGEP